MEKLNRAQIMNLPNGLTIIRVIAIPIILAMLFTKGPTFQFIAALLFLLASITDSLDGYLARRYGLVTTLGKFLDPLADKLLIVTTLIALIPSREVPFWIVIVIVGREIAVTGLRGIAASQGIVISASIWGKYKTVFEVASITALILGGNHPPINFHLIGMILLWIALLLAVFSGIDYFKKFLNIIIT
jgi:CDP-diacylglycerol--glycerol-3-phosphate 3-phosphatidyltransferase